MAGLLVGEHRRGEHDSVFTANIRVWPEWQDSWWGNIGESMIVFSLARFVSGQNGRTPGGGT